VFNGTFSVRKCIVKQKEKIMIASYGETSGFSPVSGEELTTVNGGLDPGTTALIIIGCFFAAGAIYDIVAKATAK
jgi:hypothetical protein